MDFNNRPRSWERMQFDKLQIAERNLGAFEFTDAVFRYIDQQVTPNASSDWAYPGFTVATQTPSLQETLDKKAREVAGFYVKTGKAPETASMIKAYVDELVAHGSSFLELYDAYQPNPYSAKPVLLARALNFLPSTLTSPGIWVERDVPHRLYSNEYKALLDAGFDLCAKIGTETYLRGLINSIDLVGMEANPDNNFYTSGALYTLLTRYADCPRTYKAVQEHLAYVNKKITALINQPNDIENAQPSLKLANNIRAAFEEYIQKKNLGPGLFEQAKGKVKGLVKKDNPNLVNLRDELQGRYQAAGIKRAQEVTWEKLLSLAAISGVVPYKMRSDIIKDVQSKLVDLEKKIVASNTESKLRDYAKQLRLGYTTKAELVNEIRRQVSGLNTTPWEKLIGMSNAFGLTKLPESRIAFRDYLISTL